MTDLKGYASESLHMAQRQSIGPLDPSQPAYIGYIAAVDIPNHRVTVINPMNSDLDPNLADPNDPVTPTVSNFMPLITGFAGLSTGMNPIRNDLGTGYGMQIVPFGGGAPAAPTGGEQVVVVHLNADFGAGAVAFYCFNDFAQPPGAQNIPVSGLQLQNGEWLFVTPAGAIIHLDALANINIYTIPVPEAALNSTANIRAISQGGVALQATATPNLANPLRYTVNINADLNVNINANANVNIGANAQVNVSAPNVNIVSPDTEIRGAVVNAGNLGATLALLTAAWYPFLVGHTHLGVTPGIGTSGIPAVVPPETPPFITTAFFAN